ncbi:MAG TPA: ATP-binding protein, partial [Anaerolineales bacterium]
RSPLHRWPVGLMLAGQIGGRVVYGLGALQVIQPNLQIEVIAFWFPIPMYLIALFGFRFLNPISLARQLVIDQMREGMLVADREGRVASLNPAAVALLGQSGRQVLGRWIGEILPSIADLSDGSSGESEISVGKGAEARTYLLSTSSIRDFRAQPAGQLLLLHDVTEQKRAQAQLLEQQRALATLHERERLARELHDNLGQVLGYAGFQVEAISRLIRDGDSQTAATQLDRLAGVIREAHEDLRESILDLHSAPALHQPFIPALHRYLEGFTRNYGLQAQLVVDEDLGEEPFPPDARLQVYRILQEALSNARKHGHARCVQVTFSRSAGLMRMTIQDDGAGFDPGQLPGEGHHGLQFMRERAEQIGGLLSVESKPGSGTRVLFTIHSLPGVR